MTVRQIQLLLDYLGYSPGDADGIAGKNTRAAVAKFQADYGLTADGDPGAMTQKMLIGAIAGTAEKVGRVESPAPKTGTFWDDIKYFARDEPFIGCPCGRCGGFPVEPAEKLMRLADAVREAAGKPMIPTSTVRCDAHNAEVGGVPTSRHRLGHAMDFWIPGMSSAQTLAIVRKQPNVVYAYAIDESAVHMDIGN